MFVKVKRAVVYKGKKYDENSIIEVSNDLGNRMILAGQAQRSNKDEFETQKNTLDLEKLTVKELEKVAEEKGIKLEAKMKKAEIIELLKAK
jgi:spermidine synthase